jgi:hypothetical protein
MTTNMTMIIAAIGVAVLASPAMAQQSAPQPHAAASIEHVHGSLAHLHARQAHAHQAMGRESAAERQINSDDCSSNSIYEQCGYAH